MRDRDVRAALLDTLATEHANDRSVIIEELGLAQGDVRVDVAVVNGALAGYEIKSAADTLQRLPRQEATYSKVLDHAWLVAPAEKLTASQTIVPDWWGLIAAVDEAGGVTLTVIRDADVNPAHDATLVAALLWRDEALAIAERHGIDAGVRSAPRRAIWSRLASALSLATLRGEVRETIKHRQWRGADRRRAPGDVTFHCDAKSPVCPVSPFPPRTDRCTHRLG